MKRVNEKKRKIFVSFAITLLLLFSMSLVLAQDRGPSIPDQRTGDFIFDSGEIPSGEETGRFVNRIGQWFIDFMNGLTGTGGASPTEAITNLFFGFILFSFVYSVIDSMSFFESKGFSTFLSIAITILALIAVVPTNLFTFILPGYGAMGAAILTIVPFLIIFWFSMRVGSIMMAQMIWTLFGFYFLGIYFLQAFSSGGINLATADSRMYLIVGAIGAVMIFAISPARSWSHKAIANEMKNDIKEGGKIRSAFIESEGKAAKALADVGSGKS